MDMLRWPIWLRAIGVRWMAQHDRSTLLSLLDQNDHAITGNPIKAKLFRSLVRSLDGEETFSLIHAGNLWGMNESRSGAGSTLEETTSLRARLPHLLRRLAVRRLLDIPCGDFNWMQHVDLSGIEYVGADIVADIVARNARLYTTTDRRFVHLDLLNDALPPSDAVLCRDCLVHLPLSEGVRALQRLTAGCTCYLLATTFPALTNNEEIVRGFWRPLNLELPPFSLPPALELLPERNPDQRYSDKSLGVWRIDN